jgi:hypothetical protein
MLFSLCEWIQNTEFSTAIREGALLYPIIGGIHLLAIALFGGMLLAADVRLLGWGLTRRPVSDVVQQLRVWKWVGGVVVMVTGLLLAWAEPEKLYHSKSFWIKMMLLLLVVAHALIFHGKVYGNTAQLDQALTMPRQAKLAGLLSLLLWAGIILTGRLIAFD